MLLSVCKIMNFGNFTSINSNLKQKKFLFEMVAFTADKLAEVIDTVKPYGKDVITFGYFDSLDWKKTKLLATSHSEYKKLEPKP